ncbi:hypothetical protein [Streptomyces phaeochromogenes]|uniref:hypothetical protein n=1 Tax=Streptomyces phaeochromogenes TaxID=1923 RepID=UPI0037142A19
MQTAVFGDEHSDVPVVLPTEAMMLDLFRRADAHDTFWCGLLLGGCDAVPGRRRLFGSLPPVTLRQDSSRRRQMARAFDPERARADDRGFGHP